MALPLVFSCTDIISGAFRYIVGDFEVTAIAIIIISQVRCSRTALPQGAIGIICRCCLPSPPMCHLLELYIYKDCNR